MRRWREGGGERSAGAGMDMNFCFQVYVSH